MARKRKVATVESEVTLPITPMLDMSFQLLFFFICIYQPPTVREVQMILALGETEAEVKTDDAPAQPPAGDPKEPNPDVPKPKHYAVKVTLFPKVEQGVLKGDAVERFRVEGIPKKLREKLAAKDLSVKDRIDPANPAVEVETLDQLKELLGQKGLQAALEELDKEAADADRFFLDKVRLVEDTGKLKWGKIVEVMDACYSVEFRNVRFDKPREVDKP